MDDECVYTCAFFDKNESLEEAQINKYHTICNRLGLSGEKADVLNIGCGWGSFERYLVKQNDQIKVTGLSISESQIEWANQRNYTHLEEKQLNRINLKIEDYLIHKSTEGYNAIVAIGMVEHVGLSGYKEFFRKAHSLLKPSGKILVHMIVKPESAVPTNSWMDKYIFPGGYTPSIKEITESVEDLNLRVMGIYIHGPSHYASVVS